MSEQINPKTPLGSINKMIKDRTHEFEKDLIDISTAARREDNISNRDLYDVLKKVNEICELLNKDNKRYKELHDEYQKALDSYHMINRSGFSSLNQEIYYTKDQGFKEKVEKQVDDIKAECDRELEVLRVKNNSLLRNLQITRQEFDEITKELKEKYNKIPKWIRKIFVR